MRATSTRLACENITKEYRTTAGSRVCALTNVSMSVEDGEFVTVVGSSGSGKSTLLRILAGIEHPTSGTVTDFSPHEKGRVGFVFQGSSVFPWRTVEQNLLYSLQARREEKGTQNHRGASLCRLVGLQPEVFLKKYPRELSGGELRRVAIGMALSTESSLLLFDEPTSQLDYVSRLKIQAMVQTLWLEKQTTVVYVTHDIDEAIFLGLRVLVLSRGQLKETLPVNLPAPRTREMLAQARCLDLRNRILQHLEG